MIQSTLSLVFWLVFVCVMGRAVFLARRGKDMFSASWVVTYVMATISLVNVGLALYIGYKVPLGIMPDIVTAQQAIQGQPLPYSNLTPVITDALEDEPASFSLQGVWPGLEDEEEQELNRLLRTDWIQAHPPFMTLFITPLVYFLGLRGTVLAMSFLSIGSLGLSLVLLRQGLGLELALSNKLLVIFMFLGWYPMVWTLRSGQSSALLGALLVLGWYWIRQGRPLWAGIAVGVATSLKVFPGLLLVYFLLRHRRAFISGVITLLALNLLTAAFFGFQSYEDYFHIAQHVVVRYGGSDSNWSMLGALHKVSRFLAVPFLESRTVFLAMSVGVVCALGGRILFRSVPSLHDEDYDLEYSLFVSAMPLLSPICWTHYFTVLLLPLAVLGKRVLRRNPSVWSVSGFVAILLVLTVPDDFMRGDVVPLVMQHISWKLGALLLFVPSFAIAGVVVWIAKLKQMEFAFPLYMEKSVD